MEPTNPYATPSANPYGSNPLSMEGSVAAETIAPLAGTKGWVQFMSILLWIGVGFMILIGIGIIVMANVMPKVFESSSKGTPFGGVALMTGVGVFYLILSGLYIYPAMKLWSYGSRIGKLKATLSLSDLNAALQEQQRFWKFTGIMVIVMVSLYILVIVGLVGFGAMAASRGM